MKKIIRESKWYFYHQRKRTPFFHLAFFLGTALQHKALSFDHRIRLVGSLMNHVIVASSERDRLRSLIIERFEKEPTFFLDFMKWIYEEHEKQFERFRDFGKQNFFLFSREELIQALNAYIKVLFSFGATIPIPLFAEDYLEEQLMSTMKKQFGDRAMHYFQIAVEPVRNATVLEEELALLQLASKPSFLETELSQHAEKFSWMANVGYTEDYYPLSYYQDRILKIQKENPAEKLRGIETNRTRHQETFQKLLEEFDGNFSIQCLIRTANEAVYFRSYRTEMYYQSAKYFRGLFEAIGHSLKLTDYKDLLWLYHPEIIACLKKNESAPEDLIAARKKEYSFLVDYHEKYYFWNKEEAQEVFQLFRLSEKKDLDSPSLLRGSGAFWGKVQGKVMIVLSLKDLEKVQDGDILVTHATNINMVPTLKKVKAIITEEGGILSHAAIISRELRIPSVIGVNRATEILKDGDMIEVDAEKGIIKIL